MSKKIELSPEIVEMLRYRQHVLRLRSDFTYFVQDYLTKENPANKLSASHKLLCKKLQLVAEGKIRRLMAMCPSGWGKSTILSKAFPAWLLQYKQDCRIIGASATCDFAESKISLPVQNILKMYEQEFGVILDNDSKSDWRTKQGGRYRAAGAGAQLLGERADFVILDDIYGSINQAKSAVIRDGLYNWYKSDVTSRPEPGKGAIILLQQRLHVYDIIGQLIAEEGNKWEILFLPAIFMGVDWNNNPLETDELGRKIGDSVWPEVWTNEILEEREREAGSYAWQSMYMQSPIVPGGAFILKNNVRLLDNIREAPPARNIVRSWDYASSMTAKADFTVGCLMQENTNGTFTILDIKREKVTPDLMEKLIMRTAMEDKARFGVDKFTIVLPIDPGAAGQALAQRLANMLAGYNVVTIRETGSKKTRATPLTAQINSGNMYLVESVNGRTFLEECESFPDGNHDDTVDAASTGFNHLIETKVSVVDTTWGFTEVFQR